MMLAVLVVAVFIVAFLNASPIWASVIVTLTLLLLAIALMSIYLLPSKRPFLTCAVIMGTVYGSAAFVRPLGFYSSLLTTRIMFEQWYTTHQDDIYAWTVGTHTSLNIQDKEVLFSCVTEYAIVEGILGDCTAVQRIGHCAIALSLAVIAGLVGSYVARKRAGTRGVE
jgi:hypothetical protein